MRRRTEAQPRPVTGVLTTSGRQHWRRRSPRDLARPSSRGGSTTALVLLLVLAVIAVLAVAATGDVRLSF